MNVEEYFEQQAARPCNNWLKDLTPTQQIHIKIMLAEFASLRVDALEKTLYVAETENFAEGLE